MRQALSLTLVWLLLVMSTLMTAADAQAAVPQTSTQEQNLKARILKIPVGSVVQVQLKSKEKLQGQLGTISDEGFTVKTAKGSTIEDRKVSFDEVKSIKQKGKGHSVSFWILVTIGSFFVAIAVIAGAAKL